MFKKKVWLVFSDERLLEVQKKAVAQKGTLNKMAITKIQKRDGRVVDFKQEKITDAIFKAAQAMGGRDYEKAKEISDKVVAALDAKFKGKTPTVEDVQDMVEQVLMENGHTVTAKAYILYRQKHSEVRKAREAIVGMPTNLKLSLNTIQILKERYLRRDSEGNTVENPELMFRRVAYTIAKAEEKFKGNTKEWEEKFYNAMVNAEFMPNSPTLMNAGRELGQLSACFVLPIEDSIESIFETVKQAALIHKSGGGTGFSFGRLRPRNSLVSTSHGRSSGPISFMRVFNEATDAINQGGFRRGANMAILPITHPDVIEFISCKEDPKQLNNFNISVAITDEFMKALKNNGEVMLSHPKRKDAMLIKARQIFDLLVMMAWKNGEPGVVFIDKMNKDNPTPHIGQIESTNPCGEQPLLSYESCNLGSINLAKYVKSGKIDWNGLREMTRLSVRFLDNVIEVNNFPMPQIEKMTMGNRKIGLGVMGFADMLFQLDIPYNSEESLKTAEQVMKFVTDEGRKMSEELGKERGSFLNFKGSIWEKKGYKFMRNATVTTIAPTGTISMIAECSSGIEPLFAVVFIKRVLDGKELLYVNEQFKNALKMRGLYSEEPVKGKVLSEEFMEKIANAGSLNNVKELPDEIKRIFVVAHDVTPEWHIKIQAAFQKYTDNAVSKTVNFPNWATTNDVEKVYILAYDLGCKGVTVYRDGSREGQVLNLEIKKKEDKEEITEHKTAAKKSGKKCDHCPDCGTALVMSEGCSHCPNCGYSACSIG
jgi:ribonucleoside-diphosphate reductase alpha chain